MVIKSDSFNYSESKCKECGGDLIVDPTSEEVVCSNCGLVHSISRLAFNKKPSYSLKQRNDRVRTGPFNTKLSINLTFKNYININESNKRDLRRALKWNGKMKSNEERTLQVGIIELKRISALLELPLYIMEGAFHLFSKAKKKDLIQGRSIKGIMAGCIYYTCRKLSFPLSFEEIIDVSVYDKNELKRCFKALIKELDLKHLPLNYNAYMPKILSRCNLPVYFEKVLLSYLNGVPKGYLIGKNPNTIFASLIYILVKEYDMDLTQKEVADIFEVSPASIRNRYPKIQKFNSHKRNVI